MSRKELEFQESIVELKSNIPGLSRGCQKSLSGLYRFSLWRVWDDELPKVMFVMLNPSTADHRKDDPTIRRCIGFAKSWGYGGIVICNLTPYISTNPKKLPQHHKYGGEDYLKVLDWNAQITMQNAYVADRIVLAWGNSVPDHISTAMQSTMVDGKMYHLGLTKAGFPRHPLYLAKDTPLTKIVFKSYFS